MPETEKVNIFFTCRSVENAVGLRASSFIFHTQGSFDTRTLNLHQALDRFPPDVFNWVFVETLPDDLGENYACS